ncbi:MULTISPECIES: hypothetical protein [unclassified Glutamicibacter]|uniref:hypothetical protein n=1 Tax=unclassified Glutamicibacter TaxID=2627139 RepID=UPI00381EE668
MSPRIQLPIRTATVYSVILERGEAISDQGPDLKIPVNTDGSFSHVLPVVPNELPSPMAFIVQAQPQTGECGESDSCAVRQWAVVIEPQDR